MDLAVEPEQPEISISSLQLQIEQKCEELKRVQTAFEEYTESSHELEQELEQELTRTEARNTHLSKRVQTYEHEVQHMRDRLSQLSQEFHTSEQQNALLLSSVKELERVKIQLEQQLDESLTEIRIQRATEDDLKHRFEREMEEKIFFSSENEELRRQQQLTEERFRTQINDLKLELDLQRRNYEKIASENERKATNENECDRRKEYQTIIEALQRDMEMQAADLQKERHLRQCLEHELAQRNAQVLHSEAMETEIIELKEQLIDKAKDTRERDFRIQRFSEQISMQMEEMLLLESRIASGKIDIHPKARKTRSRTDSTEISESSCSTSSTSKSLEHCSSSKSISTEPERARNAALLSRLQTVCGNIHVVCRVRPVLERMSAIRIVSASEVAIHLKSNTQISPNKSSSWKTFSFDRVFGPMETQAQVFSHVEPIAQSVMDGHNACIFAYGQTGSGKTYTMQGTDRNPGVNHRILEYLMTTSDGFRVQLGALEIYNDTLRDLSDDTNTRHLELRQNEDKHIQIAGLQMQSVSNMTQALSVLTAYHHNRVSGSTQIHAESSRSHLIVLVQLTSIEPPQSVCGKLYLVDLAGSERVKKSCVEGVMLKEATHINKSLSALADVMEALDKKAAFVPYRNSKLTFLLQDVLHASCKTLMVVNIAPEVDTASETYRSLQLATRARNVVIGEAIKKNLSKRFSAEENALQTQLDAVTRRNLELQKKVKALQQTQLQRDNAKHLLERRVRELSSKWNAECKQRKCLENAVKRLETEIQKLRKVERVARKSGSRSWK